MKIIYYYSQLNVGGAERSTVRLLNKMAEHGHEVTLLLRWSGGLLESELCPKVHCIYLKKAHEARTKVGDAFWFGTETIASLYRSRELEKQSYDVCISGLFGYDPSLLFQHVKAKQYYQLLRNDVSQTGDYGKTRVYMDRFGGCFDAYIGVSEYTTESFRQAYPEYAQRAYTIYNVLADVPKGPFADPFAGYQNQLKILTVCRLADKAKGLFRMVQVCCILREQFGESFVWFIVGDGPDRASLEEKIISAGLQRQMILCGEQRDPFPYYQHADLVAVLSYYEGLCGVVNEAKLMERPLIATEFSGIHEQITNHVNGVIVKNTTESIVEELQKLLASPQDLEKYAINGMPKPLRDNDEKIRQYERLFRTLEKRKEDDKGKHYCSGI